MVDAHEDYQLTKQQVASSFDAAARSYKRVNELQQVVAGRLLERLELIRLKPRRIIDLGAGPGTSSAGLADCFKRAGVLEIDVSHAMLKESRRQAPGFFSRRLRVCSDAEALAVKNESADLVFSNLMLQWCNNIDLVLNEVRRVLKKDGLFIFSTFGPDTLIELRESWQKVDQYVHVNAFLDMHDIGDGLIRSGLENPVMEAEKLTVNYDDVYGLMKDLKMLGAHNINHGRRKTLTGKNRLNAMQAEYDKRRNKGKLPATYEVVYGHAWVPVAPRAKRLDEHTATFPLSSLKSGLSGKQVKR